MMSRAVSGQRGMLPHSDSDIGAWDNGVQKALGPTCFEPEATAPRTFGGLNVEVRDLN